MARNQSLRDTPKIRVVSISLGAFSERPQYELWRQAVRRAAESGILVVTCDPKDMLIGRLKRRADRPGETPTDYERARYARSDAVLCVPSANRTLASYRGPRAYTYDRLGGMSWTVPYLAGLAALAMQVDPTLEPEQVTRLWLQTAVKTDAGPVVNPQGFIEAVKRRR